MGKFRGNCFGQIWSFLVVLGCYWSPKVATKSQRHFEPKIFEHAETSLSERMADEFDSDFDGRKYRIDADNDPKEYWEVIDRSTGERVFLIGNSAYPAALPPSGM
jgi:hypothetical protein